MRRVLFVTQSCYLDDSSGAAVASRTAAEALARWGFRVEALTGTVLDLDLDLDPADWLARRGIAFEAIDVGSWTTDARGLRPDVPRHYQLTFRGIPVTLHHSPTSRLHEPDEAERDEFLRLYEGVLERFCPDVLVNFGGELLAHEVRIRARARGIVVVFALHNLNYFLPDSFSTADAVIVPSRFAADHYRSTLGLDCTVLSNLVDFRRVRAASRDPRYLTFVNPSYEKGAYAFVRIADELGRRRPDIPLLVVESRGSERALVDCGLDLRPHGTVHLMGHTDDPRHFWSVTRVCLMPSLAAETQGLAAVEALANGIPVIASDRGALPETLGGAGIVLPLPERLTPTSQLLPSPEEVAPWVEAIIRLWDDGEFDAAHEQRAIEESRRWAPEVLEPLYARFFSRAQQARRPG